MEDKYGRQVDYLRISVTDRCNLRCLYCQPRRPVPWLSPEQILSYEETVQVVEVALSMGFRKFRLTGGEPLVRRGLVHLVEALGKLDLPDLSMTTNGVLLAKHAQDLKDAGLKRVNIGLDTLQPHRFRQITGYNGFEEVLQGIETALKVGLSPVKINVVLLRGINDNEVLDFVAITREEPLEVRFIELMPFGHRKQWSNLFLSAREVKERIAQERSLKSLSPGEGPAVRYRVKGHRGTVGFITPISHSFCYRCNRLRLTADGYLRPCLLSDQEMDLKTPLRRRATTTELAAVFTQAVRAKPKGYLPNQNSVVCTKEMFQVGG